MTNKILDIKFVNYNNQSRKGLYIVINAPGQNKRQFKFQDNVPIDVYIEAYNNKTPYNQLQKQTHKWQSTKNKDIIEQQKTRSQLRQKGQLNQQFKKGSKSIKINLEKLNNPAVINQIYRQLLATLVINKKNIPTILHNRQKLKNRLSYRLEIQGRKGKSKEKSLGYFQEIGKRLPEEIYNIYRNQKNYKPNSILTTGQIESDRVHLGIPKTNAKQYESTAIITKAILTLTFQKG